MNINKENIEKLLPTLVGIALVFLAGAGNINWIKPISIFGDHAFFELIYKSLAVDLNWFRNNDLGFPAGMSYHFFPMPDFTQRFIMGILSLFIKDQHIGGTTFLFVTLLLNYMASYFSLRSLKISVIASTSASAMYATLPYFQSRIASHDFLSAFYACPIACVLLMHMAYGIRKNCFRDHYISIFMTAAIVSLSGFYYFVFSVLLFLLSQFIVSLNKINYRRLKTSISMIVLIVTICLFIGLLPNFLYMNLHEMTPPERTAYSTTLVSIRLTDMFFPYLNQLGIGESIFKTYLQQRDQSEVGDSYPGLILMTGFVIALIMGLKHITTNPRTRSYQRRDFALRHSMALIFALILYTVPYGLSYLFSAFINPSIRAPERITPFIAFFSTIIISIYLDRILKRINKRYSYLAWAFLIIASLVSNPGFFNLVHKAQHNFTTISAPEYKAALSLQAPLQNSGSKAVIQYPVIPLNDEIGYINKMFAYWEFDAYLTQPTKTSRKFSYGLYSEHPSLALNKVISENPEKLALQQYSCLGFDTLLIDQRAYTDALNPAGAYMRAAGSDRVIFNDPNYVALHLPDTKPQDEVCNVNHLSTGKWMNVDETIKRAFFGPEWSFGTRDIDSNGLATTRAGLSVMKLPIAPALRNKALKIQLALQVSDDSNGPISILIGKKPFSEWSPETEGRDHIVTLDLSGLRMFGRDWLPIRLSQKTDGTSHPYRISIKQIRIQDAEHLSQ